MEVLENKFGFNRLYSKINNFSLIQSLNVSSITDGRLQALVNEIPEIKQVSIFSINSMITKLRSLPPNFWLHTKVKLFSPLGIPMTVILILIL